MPMPRRGEKQGDYVARAIRKMLDEGMSQKHAVGKAHGMWRNRRKKVARKMAMERMK